MSYKLHILRSASVPVQKNMDFTISETVFTVRHVVIWYKFISLPQLL
jgi:hypothetical protein